MKNTDIPLAEAKVKQDSGRATRDEHFDVFVSYNSTNRSDVRTICRQLESRSLKPWFDEDQIRPGGNWHDLVVAALEQMKAVVVVFGVAGPGPVQEDEIKFVYEQAKERKLHIIAVRLPGGDVPKNLVFATHNVVDFQGGPDDPSALDRLEWGITGRKPKRDLGIFGLHVEVPQADRSCFMASSHQSDKKVYKVICAAASAAGATVKQPIEFDPNEHNVYSSEVMVSIRSAALVVADGALNPHTNKPDAEVMYEVGLAKALGKPIIFVTPSRQAAVPLPMFDLDWAICDWSMIPTQSTPTPGCWNG